MTQLQPSMSARCQAPAATAYSRSGANVYDDTRFVKPCGQRIHAYERDRLLWAIQRVPKSAKILELGCGTGRLLIDLLHRGYQQAEGVDASQPMLEQLEKKLEKSGQNATTHLAEAAHTGLVDSSFDFVYAIRLLNQTASPEYALDVVKEMIRLVRPGGYVLAEFVNDYRPRWGQAAHPRRKDPTRLRPTEVVRAGEAANAETLAVRGCFFLGMQSYHRTPVPLLGITSAMDRSLSAVLPRLCARTYVLFKKRA